MRGTDRIIEMVVGVLLVGTVRSQVTQRVSVATGGAQENGLSFHCSISADGRYVAFDSDATNLVAGDTNGSSDVFVRDRQSGTTERVSVATGGAQGNQGSRDCAISADGRYVAFTSYATNLFPGDTNLRTDVFVHDRHGGTTELVSVATNGSVGNGDSQWPTISADGRFVAFESNASNLVAIDLNGFKDGFVRDRQSGTTELVSCSSTGTQGNGNSRCPAVSADGRYVAFYSMANNLVAPGGTDGWQDVFVRDRLLSTTEQVSVDSQGAPGTLDSAFPSISADGRCVAYLSMATNLVPRDTNGALDVFVRDRQSGTTERVSVATGGAQGNGNSEECTISADGRYVAFRSYATNFVSGDTNGRTDVFVHDRDGGTTELVSVATGGWQGNGDCYRPAISADGRLVVFPSASTNLVSGDTNGVWDIFLRDRDATGFISLCSPGVNGVIPCPCSNPPSASGRGCNNSAATGGASLSASGVSYLSMDSLVFTTAGEKPTALSILLQGPASLASGAIYGQGVRCVGGALKRLFAKSAAGGSITAPDFGVGDPTVSSRSAAKGDVIQPGQSRWYLVYYRDPVVLGGCLASSTFNATQTGRVDWSL